MGVVGLGVFGQVFFVDGREILPLAGQLLLGPLELWHFEGLDKVLLVLLVQGLLLGALLVQKQFILLQGLLSSLRLEFELADPSELLVFSELFHLFFLFLKLLLLFSAFELCFLDFRYFPFLPLFSLRFHPS